MHALRFMRLLLVGVSDLDSKAFVSPRGNTLRTILSMYTICYVCVARLARFGISTEIEISNMPLQISNLSKPPFKILNLRHIEVSEDKAKFRETA